MSGTQIAYQLRPNKHIDRRIFMDFIKVLGTQKSLERYEYISMGGPFLEDSKSVYLDLGIDKITSFEAERHVLDRQKFNCQYPFIECLGMNSEEFIDVFPKHSEKRDESSNYLIWLDYASSKERLKQLQEMEKLLVKLESWDVLRITMNANASTLGSSVKNGHTSIQETRLHKFKSQMGSYPCAAQQKDMNQQDFPSILSKVIGIAAERSMQGKKRNVYPISVCSYNDIQHTMITVTMIVLDASEYRKFSECSNVKQWPYLAKGWDDLLEIRIPNLSNKEKIFIDQKIGEKTAEEILAETQLSISSSKEDMVSSLNSYSKVHRFFPNFVRADL